MGEIKLGSRGCHNCGQDDSREMCCIFWNKCYALSKWIPKEEKIDSQEGLFICDHAEECISEICDRREKHQHVWDEMHSDIFCVNPAARGELVKCIPYKAKTKTKRVAVIWFGELEDWMKQDMVEIRAIASTENPPMDADELLGVVGPIDFDRIQDITDSNHVRHIAIKPPTPEPETVEQVMDRMPNPDNYKTMTGIDGFVNSFRRWQKDLKAAQERENG
jgi:hypothetical protein